MVKRKDIYWKLINTIGTYVVKNPKFDQNYLRAEYRWEQDVDFMPTGLFSFNNLKSLSPIDSPEIVFTIQKKEQSPTTNPQCSQTVPLKPKSLKPKLERLEYVNKRERKVSVSIKRNQLVEEIEFTLGEMPPGTPLYDMYMTDDEDTLILVFKEEEYID